MSRLLIVAASIFLFGSLSGCGSPSASTKPLDMGGEDGSKIAALIEDLADTKTNSRKLNAMLANGTKIEDQKKFAKYEFYVVGKPTVNGMEATCMIRVEDGGGTKLGEKEWTFGKQGDAWKIKSCPLP